MFVTSQIFDELLVYLFMITFIRLLNYYSFTNCFSLCFTYMKNELFCLATVSILYRTCITENEIVSGIV